MLFVRVLSYMYAITCSQTAIYSFEAPAPECKDPAIQGTSEISEIPGLCPACLWESANPEPHNRTLKL